MTTKYRVMMVVASALAVAFVLFLQAHPAFAQAVYVKEQVVAPSENPVDFDTMKTFMFTTYGKAIASGMSIAGVFLGVKLLWSWLVRSR